MREGHPGSHSHEGENLAPKDSIVYVDSSSWLILYSPSTNCFYFNANDYHPGDLELSLEDIERMFMFALKKGKE